MKIYTSYFANLKNIPDDICCSHRTLQQSTMRLFIATICKMAENDTDARNEASVRLAKEIAEIAKNHPLSLV